MVFVRVVFGRAFMYGELTSRKSICIEFDTYKKRTIRENV